MKELMKTKEILYIQILYLISPIFPMILLFSNTSEKVWGSAAPPPPPPPRPLLPASPPTLAPDVHIYRDLNYPKLLLR